MYKRQVIDAADGFQPWIPGIGKLSPEDVERICRGEAVRFQACSLVEVPQPDVTCSDGQGYLQASEAAERPPPLGAHIIVEQARRKADAIVADAQERAARLEQDAEERMEGLLQQRAAEEAARVRAEESAEFEEAAGQLLDRFQKSADVALDNLAAQVATLAAGVASRIIRRKVEADEEIVLEVVSEAVEQLSDIKRLRIVLNPADEATVSAQQEALLKRVGQLERLEIVADETIQRGGCLLDSDRGEVDARVESQLDVIWKRVTGTSALKHTA